MLNKKYVLHVLVFNQGFKNVKINEFIAIHIGRRLRGGLIIRCTFLCSDLRELCSFQKVLGGFSETVCYPETLSVEVMVCTIINQAKQITDQMSEMFGLRKLV